MADKKNKSERRGKIIKRAGAVLAAAVVAGGLIKVGMGFGEDKAIGKYIDEQYGGDKGNAKLVDVLVEDLNEEQDVQYENPQYRGMVIDENILSKKCPVKVYFVAVDSESQKLHMIQASMENKNFAVSGESDKDGMYNTSVTKNNIIAGIQENKLEVEYDFVEASPEIMRLLDEMSKYESIINTPEGENQHLKDSVIVGYTVQENEEGTLDVNVVTNIHAVELKTGIIGTEKSEHVNKIITFTVNSEEEILEKLLTLNLSKDDVVIKYTKAGVTTENQGKPYQEPQSEEEMGMN